MRQSPCFGDGIEQCRDAGEVLFGTLAGFALQLGFGQFDRRTIRRQRKFADITAEIDRRPIRVGLSATRSEQIGEGRTVGTCRRMEVFDNSAFDVGFAVVRTQMQIQFREAELPVDLRPRKLEVVFLKIERLVFGRYFRNTCSGRLIPCSFNLSSRSFHLLHLGSHPFDRIIYFRIWSCPVRAIAPAARCPFPAQDATRISRLVPGRLSYCVF